MLFESEVKWFLSRMSFVRPVSFWNKSSGSWASFAEARLRTDNEGTGWVNPNLVTGL
jgi:hypothetical protein